MDMPRDRAATVLPRWVIVLGSLAIGFHLFNALLSTLNVRSGPWVTNVGPSPAEPPPFAAIIGDALTVPYNRLVKVNHNFHFDSNRQEIQEITFEARLRDSSGKVIDTQKIPEPEANAFVRQRQWLLAQRLGGDEPVPPVQGVVLAPPGQELPAMYWWQEEHPRLLKLYKGNANTIPRNPQLMQPSEASFIAVRSYARYVKRLHGASAVEIMRTWRDPVMPTILFAPEPPSPDILKPFQSSYGEQTP
jgi:hypothetical protein